MESGLTITQIDSMDIGIRRAWVSRYLEKKKKEAIFRKLEISEAINYAYVGSQPPVKKGQSAPWVRAYKSWRQRLMRSIFPERQGEGLFQKLKKIRKSMKV